MAMGTWLSDKYAEGTIGHRFYAGCEVVDGVETLAAEHARALFGAEHAYVQPHSGIDANLVAYWAILAHRVEQPVPGRGRRQERERPGPGRLGAAAQPFGHQRMMGMSLDAGGHLTHGFRPNISGKMFDQASYGVDPETGLLDYDAIAAQAREFRPLVLVAGYSAYPRNPDFARLAEIAAEVGATFMVDMAHFAGLVAGRRADRRPQPGPARRRGHQHHAQVPARPARRPGAVHPGVRAVRGPRLPAGPRRPARAHHRGQGGGAGRGPPARVRRLRGPDRDQRPRARRGPAPPGRDAWSPAAPTTTWS